MLEGTPGEPYMGLPRDLLAVERNMKLRYSSQSSHGQAGSFILRRKRYPIDSTFDLCSLVLALLSMVLSAFSPPSVLLSDSFCFGFQQRRDLTQNTVPVPFLVQEDKGKRE